MTKTVCDFCGKDMSIVIVDRRHSSDFSISSCGRLLDICDECREELKKWIAKRKAAN